MTGFEPAPAAPEAGGVRSATPLFLVLPDEATVFDRYYALFFLRAEKVLPG